MFDWDKWLEIFESIRRHKLRTFLTGFGVAWGIFVLVLLLGSGNGLYKGISSNFSGYAQNSIAIFPGVTSEPYKGLPSNRRIEVSTTDLEMLSTNLRSIDNISPETQMSTNRVYYKENSGDFTVTGVYPAYFSIKLYEKARGRFLNPLDQKQSRNVAIVGKKALNVLFRGEDPIGKRINIQNNHYKVIGTFETSSSGISFGDDKSRIIIPHTSFVQSFGQKENVGRFHLTPKSGYSSTEVEKSMKHYLGKRLQFHPDDPRAVRTFNMKEQVQNFNALFWGINLFLWIVGLSTLIGGVVGVGNIMLVTVKERTREIGIRRALGATPGSILNMIILEAIVITTLSGYIGLVLGVGVLKGVATIMEKMQLENNVFAAPSVDWTIAIGATVVLILAGALAGFVPARNASRTKPVEALRYE